MDNRVDSVVSLALPAAADRVRSVLERGVYAKAEKLLTRPGWWRSDRVEDVSDDPATAVAAIGPGQSFWAFERSGWTEVSPEDAATELVSGYFALVVTTDGTVLFALEGRKRYRSVGTA